MDKNDVILLIASGMKSEKKPFLENKTDNIYLNYGLLGLGSILFNKGYSSVKMFQGDRKTISETFEEIEKTGVKISNINYPVFVSVPSFLSVSWAQEFIMELKKKNDNINIILGGRWILDKNVEWCRSNFPQVSYFSLGCPDENIEDLLFPKNWKKYGNIMISNKPFEQFQFNILNNYRDYQPVIEISRGCGRGCEFCLEKNYPVSKVKPPIRIIEEAIEICKLYKSDELNFYFQASIFNPTVEWAKDFLKYYQLNNMKFSWRFETRVDTINLESIEILSRAGLKVIDLGLESASHTQLLRMGKSKDPQIYLEKAEKLLDLMKQVGVWSKLNILLYIGETRETVKETMKWLDKQSKNITGLSVNPIIVYLNGLDTYTYVEYIYAETNMKVDIEYLEKYGYTFIDLSTEINIKEAYKVTNLILSKYMTVENYHKLKSICYTKRK